MKMPTPHKHPSRRLVSSLFIATGLFVSSLISAVHAETGTLPLFDLGPPNRKAGIGMREMMEHPDQWTQTRAVTNVLLCSVGAFNRYSDADLTKWFAQLAQWNIQLEIEMGAVKEWGKTGAKTFSVGQKTLDRVQKLGGKISSIAMDEPLSCVRRIMKKPDQYAVDETASFIGLMQQHYPDIKIIEIEPYPSIPIADHQSWLSALQKKLADLNLKPLYAYRLDVDWIAFELAHRGSWAEVKQIEDNCHSAGLPFSLIYWASGYGIDEKRGLATNDTWHKKIMEQGDAFAAIGGKPDQYCLESWIGQPPVIVPESDPSTYTGSALEFYNKFVKPAAASGP